MLPSGAIFDLKILENAFAAGTSPRIPLESLQRSPRPHSWFSGTATRQGRKEREGKMERKGREREGSIPHSLLVFNHCLYWSIGYVCTSTAIDTAEVHGQTLRTPQHYDRHETLDQCYLPSHSTLQHVKNFKVKFTDQWMTMLVVASIGRLQYNTKSKSIVDVSMEFLNWSGSWAISAGDRGH